MTITANKIIFAIAGMGLLVSALLYLNTLPLWRTTMFKSSTLKSVVIGGVMYNTNSWLSEPNGGFKISTLQNGGGNGFDTLIQDHDSKKIVMGRNNAGVEVRVKVDGITATGPDGYAIIQVNELLQ